MAETSAVASTTENLAPKKPAVVQEMMRAMEAQLKQQIELQV